MKDTSAHGKLVISLDFEMAWGVRISPYNDSYAQNIANVREVIPRLLELFSEFDIHATFATVGMLFFNNKKELAANLPQKKPHYLTDGLSPYDFYINVRTYDRDEFYYFAPDLISKIAAAGHDLGSHTFSHYYCLEEGQTIEDFADDTAASIKITQQNYPPPVSFVFPRNMVNPEYFGVLSDAGITCYRGNPDRAFFDTANRGILKSPMMLRMARLLDSYVAISGNNCTEMSAMGESIPYNVAASRFLRPYSAKMKLFEGLRLRRIRNSMTYAARNDMIYHLWWHPHNFGANINENFTFLRSILEHYRMLHEQYGYCSYSMRELAAIVDER
jgi:hypothetical protein